MIIKVEFEGCLENTLSNENYLKVMLSFNNNYPNSHVELKCEDTVAK